MNIKEFNQLTEKISEGTASDTDIARYNAWYNSFEVAGVWDKDKLGDRNIKEAKLLINIKLTISKQKRAQNKPFYYRLAAAAAILVLISTGIYLYHLSVSSIHDNILQGSSVKNDIAPGKRTATLTLANGKKIVLSDAVEGELAKQGGMKISKSKEGEIIYEIGTEGHLPGGQKLAMNSLTTAKGECYQLRLPDGTKVWLNAASILKYPASFATLKERKVMLTGEAYFEVNHNSRQPFRVYTSNQIVEDIGTEFNINSYIDESATKTTLVKGAAKISALTGRAGPKQTRVLTIGQQSVLSLNGDISVNVADEQAIAWKKGNFVFGNTDFRTVMREVARWYDVTIVYDQSAPVDIPLGGLVSRSKNISVLLKVMEETGAVHFKVEGRRVTVTK